MLVIQSKKTTHNIKISKTGNKIATDHDDYKYITTQESTSKLAQANLVSTNDIANFVKRIDLNKNELSELSRKS